MKGLVRFPVLVITCSAVIAAVSVCLALWMSFTTPIMSGRSNTVLVQPAHAPQQARPQAEPPAPAPPQSVTLLAVGDIMVGRYVETLMRRHGEDYPFQRLEEGFLAADVVLGNLEGPIDAEHRQTPDDSLVFSFPISVAQLLRQRGFTVLTIANNHILDQGESEWRTTRDVLTSTSIATAGAGRGVAGESYARLNEGSLPLHLFAFNDVPAIDEDHVTAAIRAATEREDVPCIVSIHWGAEYALHSSNRQQRLAHAMIDAGADVIVGHHPHVVQEIEVYNNRLIMYSLGNFIFDQYFSDETQRELAVRLLFEDRSVEATLIPLRSERSQPFIAESETAARHRNDIAQRSPADSADDIRANAVRTEW